MIEQCIILSDELHKRLEESKAIQTICFSLDIGWVNSNCVFRQDHAYISNCFTIKKHKNKGKKLHHNTKKKDNLLNINAAAFIQKYKDLNDNCNRR